MSFIRNSRLTRKKPIERSSTPIKRYTPVKKISDKLAKVLPLWRNVRDEMLSDYPECMCIKPDGTKLDGCTRWATTVHHKEGRGISTKWREVMLLLDKSKLMTACIFCHQFMDREPALAFEYGWILKRNIDIKQYLTFMLLIAFTLFINF